MDEKRIVYIIMIYKDDRRLSFARDYTEAEFSVAWDVLNSVKKLGLADGFIVKEVDDENTDTFLRQ